MGCTNLNGNTTKTCVMYYSLPASSLISWDVVTYPYMNLVNMTKEAIFAHGKFCQSGLAQRFSTTAASCFQMTQVTVSSDSTNTSQPWPQSCDTNLNQLVQCKYYQSNSNVSTFQLPCDCAFNTPAKGFCPIPSPQFMNTSSNLMQNALNQSQCHTLDRFNLNAQLDCGIPSTNPSDINDFENMIDYQFQQQYWSMMQTSEGQNCMNNVFPFSVSQVMANARALAVGFLVILFSLSL